MNERGFSHSALDPPSWVAFVESATPVITMFKTVLKRNKQE